jgi:hypothetical protein
MSIRPLSQSYRRLLARGGRVKPRNMAGIVLSLEAQEMAHTIAMDIFEDCCNAGMSFQDSLVSIYLSGLQHGSVGGKEAA